MGCKYTQNNEDCDRMTASKEFKGFIGLKFERLDVTLWNLLNL